MKKILALQKLTTTETAAVVDSTSSVDCIVISGGNSNCSVRCGA